MAYRDLAEAAIVGGWPALLLASHRQAVAFNRSYLDDLCASAIPLATGVRHDPVRLRRLLESVARNIASEATLESLAADVSADGSAFDPKTARTYLDALATVFALGELPAWSVALSSTVEARFGRAYDYRDNTGLEVDLILEFEDRTWAAIEVKLGASRIAEAEKSLLTLRDARVDLSRVGPPVFLAVVTGTEYAYTLPTGVHVVPLAALAS